MEFPEIPRRAIIASATAAALGVVGLAGVNVAHAHRTVTLEVDGLSRQVSGFQTEVADVLAAAGVTVSSHDAVNPAPDSAVADGSTVTVTHASQYPLTIDGKQVEVWSTASSAEGVLADITASGRGVIMAADRSSVRSALPATSSGGTVVVRADGKETPVEATAADGADGVLAKAGITASPIDQVTFTAEDGTLYLDVVRVQRGTVTEETVIPREEQRQDDATLAQGTEKVLQEGNDGLVRTTYYRQTVGGREVVDEVQGQEVVTEASPRIIAVGTRVAPVAEYSLGQFMSAGVVNWGGYKFTYYSQSVLPGGGLAIPGRHVSPEGYVCDGDGYIVLAGSAAKGTVYDTPFGAQGKIYDRGTTGNHLDVYIR